jgi:hypothetical protein
MGRSVSRLLAYWSVVRAERDRGERRRRAPSYYEDRRPPPLPAKTTRRRSQESSRPTARRRAAREPSALPLEALPIAKPKGTRQVAAVKPGTGLIRGDAIDASIASQPTQGLVAHPRAAIEDGAAFASRMRRDESIIAEVALARRASMFSPGLFFGRVGRGMRTFLFEDIPVAAGSVKKIAVGVDRLSPKKKAALVAAPYAIAMLLVGTLFIGGAPSDPVPIAASPAPSSTPAIGVGIASAQAATPPATPSTASQLAIPPVPAPPAASQLATPPAAPINVPTAAPAPAPIVNGAFAPQPPPQAPAQAAIPALPIAPKPAPVAPKIGPTTEIARTIPIRSALYAKPKRGTKRVARLAEGDELFVYPNVPAPEGWVVARRLDGEIGFLIARHLDGEKDPPRAAKKKKSSKPRKSKRGVSEAPWPK